MQLNVTGNHVEVTTSLRDYVNDKMLNVHRCFNNITSIDVILGVDKLDQHAKATIHLAKNVLHAEAHCGDMYAAIDELVDKCQRQVIKHKEKLSDKGDRTLH